jgi:hypothetical protein
MEANMPETAADRLDLLRQVFNAVAGSVESFEHDDRVGPDLAYLLGALLNDTACSWPEGRAIVTALRAHFPEGHPDYRCIDIERK